jgi:hypothetical protein
MEERDQTEIKVFISGRDSTCGECGENLGRHAWITLVEEKGAVCLACADLEHLAFLPTGDAALTRRSKKYSTLTAVVLKWSKARKRYERQGILVENEALERAEEECLADLDARARKNQRAAERRSEQDTQFVDRFADRIRQLFPGCPPGRERTIAEHACLKYSGRVGRSASAKELEEKSVRLAVAAHVRHFETAYDRLLSSGRERRDARDEVRGTVEAVLDMWQLAS